MVSFFDADRWSEIWQTITRNRRRSIMTAMGVFWGIFMLIVLLGAGTGLGRMFRSQLGDMTTNTVFLMSDQTSIPYKGMPSSRTWQMDVDDLEAIREMPEVQYVSAIAWGGARTATYESQKGDDYTLMGYSPDMQRINPLKILSGRYLNDVDEERERKVCVIGEQVQRDLFPSGESPEGKTIQVGSSYFTVIGVARAQSQMMNFGGDMETQIIIPALLLQRMYGQGNTLHMIALAGYENVDTKELIEKCRLTIAGRHLISPDDQKAVRTIDTGEIFNKVTGLFRGISALTWIVGLGTLLAGIVGISNIMLVLVRERTQEIGVRRAIGAKPSTILSQILSESFILTFVAGIFGLAAGVGLLSLVDTFYHRAAMLGAGNMPDISWQVSFGIGMTALGVLVAGSLLAGVIPAWRALSIKAVDAIREE